MTLKPQDQDILLIDGSFYLYSSHYAYSDLQNQQGQLTGATFGIIQLLFKLLRNNHRHIIVAFESPTPTFRHLLYSGYKANRPKAPTGLREQYPAILAMIKHMGLLSLAKEGYEADDVIGTLAHNFAQQGHNVTIFTRDRDMYQLIQHNVKIMYKNVVTNHQNYHHFMSVRPDQYADYLALCGDPGDCIPGAKKIGPVSAQRLLQKYDSLDNILLLLEDTSALEHQVDKKSLLAIQASLPAVQMSRLLSRINCHVDIPLTLVDMVALKIHINHDALYQHFAQLDFQHFTYLLQNYPLLN
jgi:DNA polymerase-1